MNEYSLIKLEQEAVYIYKIWQSPDERVKLESMLQSRVITALKVLDYIDENNSTYEEMSSDLEISLNTVKQYILALKRGGITIDDSQTIALAKTGRPQKIFKKN